MTHDATDETSAERDEAGKGSAKSNSVRTDATGKDAAGGDEAARAGVGRGAGLDATSRSSIENRLKSMYDEVASEPVPDRFLDLLNKLERSEGTGRSESTGGGDAR